MVAQVSVGMLDGAKHAARLEMSFTPNATKACVVRTTRASQSGRISGVHVDSLKMQRECTQPASTGSIARAMSVS